MGRILAPWLRVAIAMTAVGWGANQFAALLAVYREQGHSESFVSFAVGVYAAGLVLALFVVAAVGDRVSHRTYLRVGVLAAVAGTLLLMFGAEAESLIPVGRVVAGAATGVILAPGTAWLMELSRATPGAGPRRATVALSVGFGGGPALAGLVGQWAPVPAVSPYLLHLALSAVAVPLVWSAPVGPVGHGTPSPDSWRSTLRTLRTSTFVRSVAPTAPWVFGTAATSFAIAPGVVPVHTLPVAAGSVIMALTMITGVGLQPLAKRVERRRPGRTLRWGMLAATAGMLLGALTFWSQLVPLLFPLAAILGAAYGLLLVGGLSRLEAISAPADLTRVNAVFYALSYLGFAMPSVFVLLTERGISGVTVMLAGAVISAVTLALLPRRVPGGERSHVEDQAAAHHRR
ncbi:MFS transporter [Nocardioides insulae]|uniref:MFS transporter n=1 Tax=Nocardioides insulae TaxID=394734 RepID=UPI00040667E8|nr:MFS transporter [Nocardioides insulae]